MLSSLVALCLALAPPPGTVEGWFKSGNAMFAYDIDTDTKVFRSGASSGHLASLDSVEVGEFGALSQFVRADIYRNKRVRFSAYVKTKNVAGTGAGIWMRIDAERGVVTIDNMMRRPIRGTADWAKVSVVLDVPNDALGFHIGLLVVGPGEAWIDDAALEVVGSEVAVTEVPIPNPGRGVATQLRALYQTAPAVPTNPGFEVRP